MTTYTVAKGDTLWGISKKYKTTVDIIKADNPIIKDISKLTTGWKLKIRTPQEVAAEKAAKAKQTQNAAKKKQDEAKKQTSHPQTKEPAKKKVTWDGAEVTAGQVGRVVILKPIKLLALSSTGALTLLNTVKPPEKYRVLEIKNKSGSIAIDKKTHPYTKLYRVAANAWVPNVNVYIKFEAIPDSIKKQAGGSTGTKTNTKPQEDFMSPTIPYFESPGHRRPVLQIKKDNKIITLEMRIVNAAGAYTTQIQQNRTNGGWFINIGGAGLTAKTISGVFLDTKTNKEFDDFMSRYQQYLTAYRDGDFYSSAICTLYYKGREYKGLIAAFNYSDQESEPLLRRFSMQFLILKEKGPESGAIKAPTVVGKDKSIDDYYSDIRYLIRNPLTGKYGSDSY